MLQQAAAWARQKLEEGDPRVNDWIFMNPLHVLYAILAYFAIVWLLVRHTRNMKAGYDVKVLSIIHNLHLFSLSLYLFVSIVYYAWSHNFKLWGNGVDTTDEGTPLASLVHIYFLSKIPEFGDTFIMALKRNYHQITFLHLYHHASIFAVWWVLVYFVPGGDLYFSAALNSWIHVIMYGYYLWSSFAPKPEDKSAKPTPWEPRYYRKYITRMQLTQFILMLIQSVYVIVTDGLECPKWPGWVLFVYMLTMLALFFNFYTKAYAPKGKTEEEKEKGQ